MNTRRADSLIRRALREGGSGTLFQAEPAGGGPTPVTGKMQSGGTLLPAYNPNGAGTTQQNIDSFKSAENKNSMAGQLGALKKAQDDYHAAGGKERPIGAPMNYNQWWNGKAPMTGPDSKFGDGSGYDSDARNPDVGRRSSGSTAGVARPPSGTVQGTYPSAPRGGGRSNVGSMSRSEHVEVRGGGGSTAPAGRSRGASRITERRTATLVYRAIDEGNPYTTQPGNTPVGGGGGGGGSGTQPDNSPTGGGAAPAASGGKGGGTLMKAEPAGGGFGGGGPTAPRPGNTGSMGSGGGGGGVGGVLSQVGGAVLSTAGRAVGQAIQGNGKVDYSGMARNVGGYAAGTAVNGIAKSVMGGSSR